MLVDLNDASTIVTWWAIYPERHGALLSDWARRRPEYRAEIARARRLIAADPERRALLESSRQAPAATQQEVPPSHDEQLAGEIEH